jgi:PAS domain S-box-containing protein
VTAEVIPFETGASEGASYRLLDAAPDALIVVDADGKIRFANLQAEHLFGYSRTELLGQEVEVLVPRRFRAHHSGHRAGFTAAPRVRGMGAGLQLFGLRQDGTEFPVEISLSPFRTERGVFIVSAIRDVSERKRIEAAASLAAQRMLSAVESIQGMFALFDAEDRVVLCNSDFRVFFGRATSGPIVGQSFESLLDGALRLGMFDVRAEEQQAFRDAWLAFHRAPSGVRDLRTAGGHTLRVADRLTAEGGVVTTIWDITEDVQLSEELRRAHELAQAASAAKSEFLSSMSHELRTPLNAVLGFAQLLQRDKKTPLTERQREKVDHILKGGEHLLRLIDDVLDLSRIESGRVTISLEPVRLSEVLAEVKSTLESMAARAEISLRSGEAAAEGLWVVADRTRVSQVLMNYGSNAIKYGRRGGSVSFSVSTPTAGLIRVSVKDDGLGIPLDKQDKIFQPFQRAGQELGPIEGTGIGLAISKRLAAIRGGSVGFESTPDAGSEFWIELPTHDASAAALATPRAAASAHTGPVQQGPAHTVVYVEDNPSNIAFMQSLIEDLGAVQLITAPNAELGVELIRAHRPDVVIMDINLPGMNGVEATRKLAEWPETKDIPVLALSAAAMIRDTQRLDANVFYRYLTKPVKVDELTSTLEELFRSKPGNSSAPT